MPATYCGLSLRSSGLGLRISHCEGPALRDDEAIQLDRRGALRAPRDDNRFEDTPSFFRSRLHNSLSENSSFAETLLLRMKFLTFTAVLAAALVSVVAMVPFLPAAK